MFFLAPRHSDGMENACGMKTNTRTRQSSRVHVPHQADGHVTLNETGHDDAARSGEPQCGPPATARPSVPSASSENLPCPLGLVSPVRTQALRAPEPPPRSKETPQHKCLLGPQLSLGSRSTSLTLEPQLKGTEEGDNRDTEKPMWPRAVEGPRARW